MNVEQNEWKLVDKELQRYSKESKVDLQTQCQSTLSLPELKGKTLLPKGRKPRLEFATTYVTKPQVFWENILLTDETTVKRFGKEHHGSVYRKRHKDLKEKNSPSSQTRWRFRDVLVVLCCFWHWKLWICEQYHEIWGLAKTSGAQQKQVNTNICNRNNFLRGVAFSDRLVRVLAGL